MSNDLVTIGEMFERISKCTGAPEVKMILPAWVARALAVIMKGTSKITGKPALLTSFAIYNLARNNHFPVIRPCESWATRPVPLRRQLPIP